MWNKPQTLIGVFRAAINNWRKSQDWSRETVVQHVVEAHERIDGPATTGIVFDPKTRDAFDRQKVNAERVFRWLDDETKDSTLLPANLIPSVLEAMPMDLRLHVLNEILRPLGIEAHSLARTDGASFDASGLASTAVKESAEATVALLAAGANPTPESLRAALKEMSDAEEAAATAKRALIARIEQDEKPGLHLRPVA